MNRLLKTIYLGLSVSLTLVVFGLFNLVSLSPSMSARAAEGTAVVGQTVTVNTEASSDAIAIRVLANDHHLSAREWFYQNISTKRSLQSLTVDGYDAVRDNRTVYVAASNIAGCGTNINLGVGDCLSPVIAIISFNQNISTETVDIFGQILNNWKFNQNLNNRPKTCSDNVTSCSRDEECRSQGSLCSSLKEKVIRDTKRLITLASIKTKLENYRSKYQHYPNLEAGSYLPNKTLSVWPSWQKTLAAKLGSALPIDPVNKMGSCSGDGINPITCWNEQTKRFYDDRGLDRLPSGSLVMRYEFVNNSQYNLCAQFETSYANIVTSQNNCTDSSLNKGPVINCRNIVGLPGKPFTGYAEVSDREGDLITSATINPTSLTGWDPITVSLTPDRRYVKIDSNRAGGINRYNIALTVKDSLNNATTVDCPITIGGNRFSLSYSAGAGGHINGALNQIVDQGGSGTQVTAVADAGKHFVEWSDNHITTAQRTDTNVSSNIATTASFDTNPSYTISFNTNGGNSLDNPSISVTQGLQIGPMPTPTRSGYAFGGWNTLANGNGDTYTANTTYNNNGNLTLYAKWSRNSFTLTYTAGVGGTISGTNPQTVNINGNGTQVTAQAGSGYDFVRWSDNNSTNPVRREMSVTRDYNAQAIFAVRTWRCGDILVDDRPGLTGTKNYQTIQIGDQCWMKENLKYLPTTGVNGTYGNVNGGTYDVDRRYFIYDLGVTTTNATTINNNSNYNTYGALYNWAAASSACPAGWHLPRSSEFISLINELGGFNHNTFSSMKSTDHWGNYSGDSCAGNNNSGFSALAAAGFNNGFCCGIGYDRIGFWTNSKTKYSQYSQTNARKIGLGCGLSDNGGSLVDEHRGYGYSVRCVKGAGSGPDEVERLTGGTGEGDDDNEDVVNVLVFDPQGGEMRTTDGAIFSGNVKSVTANTRVGDLPNATKGTLVFNGWYTGKNGQGDKYTTETTFRGGEIILFAYWTEPESDFYVLEYSTNEGGFIIKGEALQKVKKGESGEYVQVKQYNGFKFVGWDDGVKDNPRKDVKVDHDIIVKAIFEKDDINKVTVTFYANDALTDPKVIELDWGAYLKEIPNPSRDGYTFAGWYDHPTDKDAIKIDKLPWGPIKFNLSYYARWETAVPSKATVIFNKNGGNTEANPAAASVTIGSSLSILPASPVRDHYIFNGWNTKSDGTGSSFTASTAVTANITVYAQWIPQQYTVIFNDNFEGGSSASREKIDYLSKINPLPQPIGKRDNYYFAGWNTQSDGEGINFTVNTPVTENITLYAKWAVQPMLTVTFDYNYYFGGTKVIETRSVYKGSKVNPLPNHTRECYDFLSWNTKADGSGTVFTTDTVVNDDITVYAQQRIRKVTVTFDDNFDGGGIQTREINCGDAVGALPQPTKTRGEAYYFFAWNPTRDNGGGNNINPLKIFKTDSIYYATWAVRPMVTVTFNENYIRRVEQHPVEYRQTITTYKDSVLGSIPNIPNPGNGYVFSNWTEERNGGNIFNPETEIIIDNMDVYAKYTDTCVGVFEDSRDNNSYRIFRLKLNQYDSDSRCFFKDNLKFLPKVDNPNNSGSGSLYYVYNYYGQNVNEAKANENYIKYGVLYNQTAAQSACPAGWRLPEIDDLKNEGLTASPGNTIMLEPRKVSGMLSTSWVHSGVQIGTNSLGFDLLPAGSFDNSFGTINIATKLHIKFDSWLKNELSIQSNTYSQEYPAIGQFNRNYDSMNGLSVRCVRNP